eukprot:TRINITY_DN4549_c0_g1_i1.p1 TRINITY_DN4549_c0_g1~~TRINITY_DN4549_c0_g1_i1.p1  ORF type:complete len:337 (+),score=79.00 TRINITY_DN4549_c0_g1_i1:884-1894(+)
MFRAAVYNRFGPVLEVLSIQNLPLASSLAPTQVLVKFLASPLNPADFNTIEGVYGVRPDLPAIGGSEGVAEVVEVGNAVKTLKPGHRVIPAQPGTGTWRTHAISEEDDWIAPSAKASVEAMATVGVNPCTAWRMLHDYGKGNGVVIQNAANSAVGVSVIQLARELGIRTINVVRKRDDATEQQDLENWLKSEGADLVLTEDVVADGQQMKEILVKAGLEKPALALNAVGGTSSLSLAKSLASKGKIVTYGGMSMKPVSIPTSTLIFNDISAHGFWVSRWVKESPKEKRQEMIDQLLDFATAGKLKTKLETFPFDQIHDAVRRAKESKRNAKVLLKF